MGLNNRICKVAIIGAGNMALEHARAFSSMEQVQIIGIFSRTKSKAEILARQFNISIIAESVDELYEKTKADLVIVAVYETSMLEVALNVMAYDWSIFLEKPPGYTLEQAKKIHQFAIEKSRRVIVGLNRRFLSSSQHVLKSINASEEKRFVSVCDQQSLSLARHLNHHPEVVKHWMYANSIHLIDYLAFLCRGSVEKVSTFGKWTPEDSLAINALVTFSSGDEGFYQGIWEAPGPWTATVTTKKIRWEMKPLEKASYQLVGERQLHQTPVHEWDEHYKPGFRLQAEQAVVCALGLESSSPTISDAVKTMEIIHKIYLR